jgi:CRP-like cAMP-binding protein
MLQDRSVELLSNVPLFAGWDPAALSTVVAINTRFILPANEPLLLAGDRASGAFLIVAGAARRLADGGRFTGERYGPGSLLAEMAMFAPVTYDHTVIAESDVEAIELSRERMHGVLRLYPDLAQELAGRIQGRLKGMEDRLRQIDRMLAESLVANEGSDRTSPEQERDRTAAPSPAPRLPRALNGTPPPVPASPIHGPAVAHGSNGANPVHGSSTR